jgi:8-oxo-dGTP pyrophosphatase MutT (NUDIX family)
VREYYRETVRIVCLDAQSRVLLLRWRDPFDGTYVWALPGGGIDPGELSLAAAHRELVEETGLDPSSIVDGELTIFRNHIFGGVRLVGPEKYFLVRYGSLAPELSRHGLLEDEQQNLAGYGWLAPQELIALDDRLEPPTLTAVLARLAPGEPWGRDGC